MFSQSNIPSTVFHVTIERSADGYRATVDELPDYSTDGETILEVLTFTGHVIDGWLREVEWENQRAAD